MFNGKTILERISSTEYKFIGNLSFENDKYIVTIKKGLTTDGASIPRLFWTIIGCPLSGKYVGSALIHDGLYGSHALSKEESDILFLEMMAANKVGFIKRNLMYLAVKIGGKSAYYGKTDEYIKEASKYVSIKEK